jgi:hypothetical protein
MLIRAVKIRKPASSMPRAFRSGAVLSCLCLALLGAAGCGAAPGGTAAPTPAAKPAVAASPSASPVAGVRSDQEALRELQATVEGYKQAEQALRSGDRQQAVDLVNTAYLDHFERVEGWLDQHISPTYREDLENTLSGDIRRRLRDGTASDTEILALFPVAYEKLSDAQQRIVDQM